ncbi:MAG: UDP-glucose 4-epimerase [Cyanobacteria bacterium RYN_339]|nr:UDP-glucose 4-epimerase [Cyanobacteria bacterium RYN_339]
MHIFVTGGAGFIGSHTVDLLEAEGHQVRIFDDLSTGSLGNLAHHDNVIWGDVLDAEALTAAMAGCDAVLHLAAVVSVPDSIVRPAHAHATNATGTLNVLEAARRNGIRRVVLASSAAVYGANQRLPLEEQEPPMPLSPYAVQKWENEAYARCYADLHGLRPICLRYFNVFGPRQDPASPYSGVLSRFLAAVATGAPVTINGDGAQSRDFVYVGDVARANVLALTAPFEVGGAVLNVGTGTAVTVLEAYEAIRALAGGGAEPTFGPERRGDVRHSLAAIGQAEALLGYKPRQAFGEGLARTLAWARERRAAGTQVMLRAG